MICKHKALFNFWMVIAFLLCSSKAVKTTQSASAVKNAQIMPDTAKPAGLLQSIMLQNPQQFNEILKKYKDLNVQIIYTQVNRGANGMPALQNHYFNVDANKYYYPASTVKLPVVLLALQKLHELQNKQLNANTTMLTGSAFSGQT
ncbi:MAG TPA: hypothetical protein PK987_11300, partial [Ferruginibacter sp.]|nr:hypothetical protein [Ferruginibacter sp.]